MSSTLIKSLNHAIPVHTPVKLDLTELFEIFKGTTDIQQEISSEMKQALKKVSAIIGYDLENIFFVNIAEIMFKNTQKELVFSKDNLFLTVSALVSDSDTLEIVDDPTEIQNKLIELKKIKRESTLKNSFPIVYNIYKAEEKKCQMFWQTEKLLRTGKIHDSEILEIINAGRSTNPNFNLEDEFAYAHRFNVTTFINRLVNIINTIIEKEEDICNVLIGTTLNIPSLHKQDKEKLELYIAYSFLNQLKKEPGNEQRYMYYITNYFRENQNLITSSLKITFSRQTITVKYLYEQYKSLLINHPELKAIYLPNNFSNQTPEEVEKWMDEYLKEISVDWDILPEPDGDTLYGEAIILRNINPNLEEERRKREQRNLDLLIAKKEFYGATTPIIVLRGKDTFKGYMGYVYANGVVLLDKLYENQLTLRPAEGEALYVMNLIDFFKLSKYHKIELITGNYDIKRIVHAGNWQDRAIAETNKPGTINPKALIRMKSYLKE